MAVVTTIEIQHWKPNSGNHRYQRPTHPKRIQREVRASLRSIFRLDNTSALYIYARPKDINRLRANLSEGERVAEYGCMDYNLETNKVLMRSLFQLMLKKIDKDIIDLREEISIQLIAYTKYNYMTFQVRVLLEHLFIFHLVYEYSFTDCHSPFAIRDHSQSCLLITLNNIQGPISEFKKTSLRTDIRASDKFGSIYVQLYHQLYLHHQHQLKKEDTIEEGMIIRDEFWMVCNVMAMHTNWMSNMARQCEGKNINVTKFVHLLGHKVVVKPGNITSYYLTVGFKNETSSFHVKIEQNSKNVKSDNDDWEQILWYSKAKRIVGPKPRSDELDKEDLDDNSHGGDTMRCLKDYGKELKKSTGIKLIATELFKYHKMNILNRFKFWFPDLKINNIALLYYGFRTEESSKHCYLYVMGNEWKDFIYTVQIEFKTDEKNPLNIKTFTSNSTVIRFTGPVEPWY